MNVRERHSDLRGEDAEHQLVLSYLNSSAWEARLAEARIKRQAIMAGLVPGTSRHNPRAQGLNSSRPRPSVPTLVEAPSEAIATDAPVSWPADVPERKNAAARRPLALPAAGLFSAALLVGAAVFLNSPDTLRSGPEADARIAVPNDVVTRNETGDLSGLGAVAKPRPIARASLTGIDALAASLEDMALTNRITVVTSARQAKALVELDRTKAAASVRVTPFELDRSTVSFYHPNDAEAATDLATRLDGETMDLIGLLPAPPTGSLSIYLAGS